MVMSSMSFEMRSLCCLSYLLMFAMCFGPQQCFAGSSGAFQPFGSACRPHRAHNGLRGKEQ